MRRKRHRKKTDDLSCTADSEIEGREKNTEKAMEIHENQVATRKRLPIQFKDSSVEFLCSRNSPLSSLEQDSHLNLICDVDSDDSQMAQTLKTKQACDLLLECQEESLYPVQQNFFSEEWLRYVKYTATLSQIPSLTAVNGSDVGEKIPSGCLSTPKELPVLYFTNNVQSPKIIIPPQFLSANSNTLMTTSVMTPFSSSSSNAAIIQGVQNPVLPRVPFNSLIGNNVTAPSSAIPNIISGVSLTGIIPAMPNIFPVKLEKVSAAQTSDTNEEVLPLISLDSKIENFLYETENASTSDSVIVSSVLEQILLQNSDVSSPYSNDSNSDQGITPDILSKMEVNFVESDSNPIQEEEITKGSIPLPTGSEKPADLFNGPKIVDIVSASAGGHSVYYQSTDDNVMEVKMMEFDRNSKKAKETPNTPNLVATEDVLPKVVTQFSIFSMQKTIAVISSGNLEPSKHNLLAIRPHIPPPSPERTPGIKLKNRLREENFLTLSVWWLVQKRFLPLSPPCSTCFGKSFRICSSNNYLDNLCWICENPECSKTFPLKRPKFFERFPHFSLEELLILTYHWAVKSPIWVILKDISTSEDNIWEYFTALQQLCGRYMRGHLFGKAGRHISTVEASAVKLGKFFILCAYDRDENVSRLQALTTEEACNSMKHIKILERWLSKACKLITWKSISDQFLHHVDKHSADPSIIDFRSPGPHILNASKYLGKTMVQLFQNICHDKLTIETVQNILDEVQWRERRGKIEESAFWNILNEISSLNETYYYTEAKLGNINKDRYFYTADASFQMRWGPYDIGERTSSSYNPHAISENVKEAISSCVTISTNRILDSKISACASTSKPLVNDISDARSKHPICVTDEEAVSKHGSLDTAYLPADKIKPQDMLSVRVLFNTSDKAQIAAKTEAVNLGKHLRKEGYLSSPIRWLIKKKLIDAEMPCYVCQSKSILLDNNKFPDGVSWVCQRSTCRFQNKFKRPDFFASFGFKMELIFAVIYHWAVQSDYKTLIKSVPMNELNIIQVQRKLQHICSVVARKNAFKIGGSKFIVEVALVKFSNCFILGAMERETKLSRLQAYSIQTKLHIDSIRSTLVSWLHPDTTVVVNSNKYLGSYAMDERIHLVFADKTIQNVNSKKYHTLTISNYLQNHMRHMFGSFNVQSMSAQILQVYLDELVWRERYGGTPNEAFKNIMRHIFTTDETDNNVMSEKREDLILRHAAVYYDLPFPLPKPVVCLEKLPDYMLERYTSAALETESFNLDRPIKEEILSDDEVQIVNDVKVNGNNSKANDLVDKESVKLEAFKVDEKAKINTKDSKINKVEKVNKDFNIDKNLPSTSTAVPAEDVLVNTSDSRSKRSVDESLYNVYYNGPKLSVKKSNSHYRYSNKCYTSKRKAETGFSASKFQCIECKETVSDNHFKKMYSCTDCKYYKYSTFCQKAYAQHRYYVLFGRKLASNGVETTGFHHKAILNDSWYCSCGFNSLDGNELASHLVNCDYKTCYMHIDVAEPHVL